MAMETIAERRRRKLTDLANKFGLAVVASNSGLSKAALEQVIKGTLLPAKQDGTQNPKGLGTPSARKIEDAFELGRGWFDADDSTAPAAFLSHAENDSDVMQAIEVLAHALSTLDKATRSAVAPLLSLLAQEPDQFENIATTLGKLLPGTNLARIPKDDESAGREISAVLPSLERKELQGHAKRISNQGRGRT